MRRYFISLICIMVSVFMLTTLCSAAAVPAQEAPETAAERTVMLYGIGSNLETFYGMLTWNLVQILEADIPEDVNVVVMTGGSMEWQTEPEYLEGAEAVDEGARNRFWICSGRNAANAQNGHGRMTLLEGPEGLENVSMSNENTLQAFIDFAAEKYPAQKYDLILWDHGGGPHGGFGVDELDEDGDTMSMGQIITAVKNSRVERFDIIDFDACLMSSVEIAASLSEFADYLVVSPEIEPGYGQEYTTWLDALAEDPGMDGFELGKIIVDACIAFYEDENTEGYGEDATLSVIDTKNFRERMIPLLMQLAQTMNKEITEVGKENLLLNFTDEFRMLPMPYRYYYEELADLGSLADHLGINMSELDIYSTIFEMDNSPNAYTGITEEIEAILADQDGSGDDVIYDRVTESTTRPVFAEVRYTRNEDGELEPEESISPTGLSIFFNPLNIEETLNYLNAMESVCDLLDDEEIKAMLREYEMANARYLLAAVSGQSVSVLLDAGTANVYYKVVRDFWQEKRELSEPEIETYKRSLGLTADITAMKASEWDAYLSTLIELLDRYSDVDTETWLALLTAQQSSEAVYADRSEAVGIDKNGDGAPDAYRVTVKSPLGLIKDVSMNINGTGIEIPDYWADEFGDQVNLGKLSGTMAMEEFLTFLHDNQDLNGGVMAIYHNQETRYDLDATVDSWYELIDSEGTGHIISVGDVDLDHDTQLKIPVIMQLTELDEFGEETVLQGYLIYSNGRFIGFSDELSPAPVIPLSQERFDGALVEIGRAHV